MTIQLAGDVAEFVSEQVRLGTSADEAGLVNDLLRAVREQRRKPFTPNPELEAWLLASAEEPASPLVPDDFQGIRERIRTRQPAAS